MRHILMILYLLLFLFTFYYFCSYRKKSHFSGYFSFVNPKEQEMLDKFFSSLDKNKNNNLLYWPIDTKNIHEEIKKIHKLDFYYYYGFIGMDLLASKKGLYHFLYSKYKKDYQNLIPLTIDIHHINNPEIRTNFEKSINSDSLFILKKETQRQTGLKIIKNYKEALKLLENQEYKILQKVLESPYTIKDSVDKKNRKINLRIYFLVVMDHNKFYSYIYKDGFLYYSLESFKLEENEDNLITSGYIPREIYSRNPLTIEDFKKYVSNSKKWDCFWDTIICKFNKVSKAYKDYFLSQNKNKNSFHIFGADIEPSKNLEDCRILEINKFPDLGAKDERDKNLKTLMLGDSLTLVNNRDFILDKIDTFSKVY